jgi:hypothetical protein
VGASRLRVNRKKADWIGHILHRNCLQKHCIEGKIKDIGGKNEAVSRFWLTFKKAGGNEI